MKYKYNKKSNSTDINDDIDDSNHNNSNDRIITITMVI